MSTSRSHSSESTGRYRTHDRDELLKLVLEETNAAAENEAKLITREFDRREEEKVAHLQNREAQRRRDIIEARRRERERLDQARARREAVLREIEEDDLRLRGQWPPQKTFAGPFDTSEFGARSAAPTTDEWVVSQLTMASVERRLGIYRLSGRGRNTKMRIGANVVLLVALTSALIFGGRSSHRDIDATVYPVTVVSVVETAHPTSTITFRAPAPIVARRHSAGSARSSRATIDLPPRATRNESPRETTTEPRRIQPPPLEIDIRDADNLWGRGSE